MDNIFEQLLRLYKASLADLIIGYPLNESPINEMWELIIIIYFVINGFEKDNDILYISDHFYRKLK